VKIKCKDKSEKTAQECLECGKCYPKPIMNVLLAGRDRKRVERDKPRFGVTRLTGGCLRKTYYDLTEDLPLALEKLWIFTRGHAIHEFFQKDMKKEEKEIFKEKKFSAFDLIGFIDAIHDGTLYEFKTTVNIPQAPQESHVMQGQAYFTMLSPEEQAKVEKIQVIYFSLHRIKVFEIPKRDLTHWLEARGVILSQALKNKSPPKREEGWLCSYCDFKDKCSADKGKKRFDLF